MSNPTAGQWSARCLCQSQERVVLIMAGRLQGRKWEWMLPVDTAHPQDKPEQRSAQAMPRVDHPQVLRSGSVACWSVANMQISF
jgi:hypothetical protein